VPAGVTTFTVSYPTSTDALADGGETTTLTVGGQSGTGTINDPVPPTLDLDANNSTTTGNNYITGYTENGVGLPVADTDIDIVDPDNTTMASAVITLTNALTGDQLALLGALPGGITSSIVAGVGIITVTLTGPATLANFESAIQLIGYSNTSDNPSTTPRTITVVVNDGNANSNTATTTINVTAVNDPPVGVADARTAVEGTTTAGMATVLGNDTDPEGNALSVLQVATTSGGTVVPVNGTNAVTTTLGGTVIMNTDGTFSYTAPARIHPTVADTFVYRAYDSALTSAWTTVTITITDTGPTAIADVDSVGRNSSTTGNVVTGAGGVSADTLAADAVTVSVTGGTLAAGVWTANTTRGTLQLTAATGAYTYTSDVPAVVAGGVAQATFTTAEIATYGFDGGNPYVTPGDPTSGLSVGGLAAQSGNVTGRNNAANDQGIGVETGGGATGATARIQNGETLILDFSDTTNFTSNSIVLRLTALDAAETATWQAFDTSGAFITSGTITGEADQDVTATIAAAGIQYIALTSAGATYLVNGANAAVAPDVFTYTLTDADGTTSSTTLTMNTDSNIGAVADVGAVNEAGLLDGSAPNGVPTVSTGNILSNDTGLTGTTVITNVAGTLPVAGVITVNDAFGTLQVWTIAGGGHVVGDFVYTLNNNTISAPGTPVSDQRVYSYLLTDPATGQTSSSNLTIAVTDDAPAASNSTAQVVEIDAAGYNIVLILDISGSMTAPGFGGEVRSVADDGTASITTRLAMAKAGMVALVEEYFAQSSFVAVKIGLFGAAAGSLNGGAAYTNKQTLIDAINAITGTEFSNTGTNYELGLNVGLGLWQAGFPTAPSGIAMSNASYFMSDGQPNAGNTATATANYLTYSSANSVKSYAVALGTGIPDPVDLNNIHNVDANLDGVRDPAIIVPDLNRLGETLVATVPSAYSGSVGGTGGASNVTFGADGGYISYIEVTLDGTDADTTTPDQLVQFTYDPVLNQITNNSGGYYATTAGSLLNLGGIDTGTARGFTWGTLIFDFSSGQYTYFTAPSVAEGDTFTVGFQVTDNDGDTATAVQTIEVIDGGPIARTDYHTIVANERNFEGNVINGIGTDGGASADLVDFASASVSKDSIIDNAVVTSVVFRGSTFDLTTASAGTAAGGTYTIQTAAAKTVTSANVATAWTGATMSTWGFDGTSAFVTAGVATSGINVASLTPAQAALVQYRDNAGVNNDGTGVETGALTDVSRQIQNGEQLVIQVDATGNYASALATVTDLGAGEVAQWHAYNSAGLWVGSGTYTGTGATAQNFAITPTASFQYVMFTSTAAGNVYSVNGLSAAPVNRLTWASTADKTVTEGNDATDWSTPVIGTWGFDGGNPYVTAGTPTSGINTASLTAGAAGLVRYRDNAGTDSDGTGVDTVAPGSDTQRQIENGESLIFRLDTVKLYGSANITVTNLAAGEVAQWHAFDDAGAWVASGTYTGITATAQTFTISPGAPFQYVVMTSTAAANVYSVNGVTASREALVFENDGYYSFTPIDTETTGQTQAGAVTTTFTSQANGALNGVVLTGFSRTANLQLAATYTAATLNYDGVGGVDASGVGVPSSTADRVDNLETLVVRFDSATHARGVQNVVFELADNDSNLGGGTAVTYSVYDIHDNLLGQYSSILEDNIRIPTQYSNIGRVEIEAASAASVKVQNVTFNSITGPAGGAAAVAPEQLGYTLTDTDADASSAFLNLNVINDHRTGTTGVDTFTGSALNDYLSGKAGNDSISGGAGYDLIRGDDGDDTLNGEGDGDRLFGGDGNDSLSGGTGNDELYGEVGNDIINGDAGTDYLEGGEGNDTLNGGADADTLVGGKGNDSLDGGGADGVSDVFRWSFADAGVKGLPAVDTINNFDNALAGSGGDILDLRDLLVGETSSASSLDDYLHFEITGGDTKIHISAGGEFSAAYSFTREVQTITLVGVDLVGTFNTDAQIIQDLLTRGKLLTD
jgi:hypothetical protein